jgi:uncharacterized protein (DUF885 family)
VKAISDWLAKEQHFLMQLSAIDPIGLPEQEKTNRELLIRRLADHEEAAEFKEWEMPVNQMGGTYAEDPCGHGPHFERVPI